MLSRLTYKLENYRNPKSLGKVEKPGISKIPGFCCLVNFHKSAKVCYNNREGFPEEFMKIACKYSALTEEQSTLEISVSVRGSESKQVFIWSCFC